MNKETFLNEVEKKLNILSPEDKQEEINKLNEYILNGQAKNISEEDVIRSLGSVDDIVKTIYVQRGIKEENKKSSLKVNIVAISSGIKYNFLSKDKKLISNTIGNIITIIIVAIILKVPFIFFKTLLLDFLNGASVSIKVQNIISYLFEIGDLAVAVIYIYRRFKKCFIKKN